MNTLNPGDKVIWQRGTVIKRTEGVVIRMIKAFHTDLPRAYVQFPQNKGPVDLPLYQLTKI